MKTSPVAVGSQQYDLSVHVTKPTDSGRAKTPVMVYLNQTGNAHIGCYIYTIGNERATYSSVLQQGQDAGVQDLATNLGRVLAKKFSCPSYVCMSGYFSMYDYGELCAEVVREVGKATESEAV